MNIDQSDLLSPWMSPALHHVHRKTAVAMLPWGAALDPFQLFLFLQRSSIQHAQEADVPSPVVAEHLCLVNN